MRIRSSLHFQKGRLLNIRCRTFSLFGQRWGTLPQGGLIQPNLSKPHTSYELEPEYPDAPFMETASVKPRALYPPHEKCPPRAHLAKKTAAVAVAVAVVTQQ